MYLLFLALWIIFNGQFTWEILAFGLVIAGILYWFACRFMGFSVKRDLFLCKKSGLILKYIVILVIEIVKANFTAMKILFSEKDEIEPILVKFKSPVKSKAAKAFLANSITLTPGTITVSLENDEFQVHCLDKSLSEGLTEGIFAEELKKLEGME